VQPSFTPGAASTPAAASPPVRARRRPQPRVAAFRLGRAALVRISVQEQAPVCRPLGRFVVHAGPGANVVRAPRRLHGRRLGAGTYRLVATKGGAQLFAVRFRLAPTRGGFVARRTGLADVCSLPALVSFAPSSGTASSNGSAAAGAAARPPDLRFRGSAPPIAPPVTATPPRAGGHQRPPLVQALNPIHVAKQRPALLFVLLGAAIGLLAAAVAGRHRALTVAGLGALAAALLVLLLA
jgi:hypothetical protein